MAPLIDQLTSKMLKRGLSPRRFFISASIAIALILFAVVLMICNLDAFDYDLPPYQPNTLYENGAIFVSRTIFIVVGWPFLVAALVGGDRLVFLTFLPLLIVTGLYWAFLVEWIVAIKRRSKQLPRAEL